MVTTSVIKVHILTISEFAQGKVDPHEAGQQGGHTSGSGTGSSDTSGSSGGSAKGRKVSHHAQRFDYAYITAEFAHGKVDPVEAGKKGGNS